MFPGEVNELEILPILRKCENKRPTDSDGLDITIVKRIVDCITKPLTFICNLSIQSGVFPEQMKVAKVILLFRNSDEHIFNNYRPMSLLSQFSKIKVVCKKKLLEKYKLIPKNNVDSEHSDPFSDHSLIEKYY